LLTFSCLPLTFSSAFWTVCLHLHLHTHSYVHILHDYSLSFAFLTRSQLSTECSSTSAVFAVNVSFNIHFFGCSCVHFFQWYMHICSAIWSLLYLMLPIFISFDSINSLLIKHLSLIVIREHFISSSYFGKMLCWILITLIFVGMVFFR